MNKKVLSHYFDFYHGFNSKNMKIVKLHRSSMSRHRIGKQEQREKTKTLPSKPSFSKKQ